MTTNEQLKYAYQLARGTRPHTDDFEAVQAGDMTQDDWYERVEPDIFSDALDVCEDLDAITVSDEVRQGLMDAWRETFTDYLNLIYGS